MKIQIAHLYPELLNLYGDRGNIMSLVYRCEKRGIECEIKEYGLEDIPDFENNDIIFIGGGSDKDQQTVCTALCKYKSALKEYVEKGGVVLAVCGGFELIGSFYKQADGTIIPAAEILNFHTEYSKKRHIGNVVIESTALNTTIVGFENHSGIIVGDGFTPLGKIITGVGSFNNGYEGIIYKNLIASYLHGPLLPKNPSLCDYIISKALEGKYGEVSLESLDDEIELAAHRYSADKFGKRK